MASARNHESPYPAQPPPSPRGLRAWYDRNWIPIVSLTAWPLVLVLIVLDLLEDWAITTNAYPIYGALIAVGASGVALGQVRRGGGS